MRPVRPVDGTTAVRERGRAPRPVRLGPKSVAALVLVSAVGVVAFGWPLLAGAD
ncbi:ECF transporter S component, partial [Streptomyces sp. ZEA17I]